ncbi:hypothetical protein [Vreelandella titanicae]|uniref:hypothetical protein n=1 Tax=Vreelandella titanicae TaxID=664683 RepID=UPI003FD81A8D
MAAYTQQYAAKIDAAAVNADRAENAKSYVEAMADAYKVNLLDQFKRDATLSLDYIEGRYWTDDGQRLETSDFSQIGTVDRTENIYLESPDGSLQSFPAGVVARGWRDGRPAGKISGETRTNTAAYSNDPANWTLSSGAVIESIETVNGIKIALVRLPANTSANITFNNAINSDGIWTISARVYPVSGYEDGLLETAISGATSSFLKNVTLLDSAKWTYLERTEDVFEGSFVQILRRKNNSSPDVVLKISCQQIEKSFNRSSYIPVGAAGPETRTGSGEIFQLGSFFNKNRGSFIFEISGIKRNSTSSFGRVLSFDDGTTLNRIYLLRLSNDNYRLGIDSEDNEGYQSGQFSAGDDIKCVFTWDEGGGFYLCANGSIVDSNEILKMPSITQYNTQTPTKIGSAETSYLLYLPCPLSQAAAIEVTQS